MTTRKPVLLIDQDDVLAQYIEAVTLRFNEVYNTNHEASECVRWDLVSVFGENIKHVMHEPDIFMNLTPVPEAIETFKRLYESGLFEMYIVTAAKASVVPAKSIWIEKYMPFLPEKNVIFCMDKHMVKGDYLLDDGMHNIEAFKKAGGHPIIFNRPHNENEGKAYARVGGWLEFEAYIMNECYPEYTRDYTCAQAQ